MVCVHFTNKSGSFVANRGLAFRIDDRIIRDGRIHTSRYETSIGWVTNNRSTILGLESHGLSSCQLRYQLFINHKRGS